MKKLLIIILLFLTSCDSINSSSTIYIKSNEQVLNVYSTGSFTKLVLKDTSTNIIYVQRINNGELEEPTLTIKQLQK